MKILAKPASSPTRTTRSAGQGKSKDHKMYAKRVALRALQHPERPSYPKHFTKITTALGVASIGLTCTGLFGLAGVVSLAMGATWLVAPRIALKKLTQNHLETVETGLHELAQEAGERGESLDFKTIQNTCLTFGISSYYIERSWYYGIVQFYKNNPDQIATMKDETLERILTLTSRLEQKELCEQGIISSYQFILRRLFTKAQDTLFPDSLSLSRYNINWQGPLKEYFDDCVKYFNDKTEFPFTDEECYDFVMEGLSRCGEQWDQDFIKTHLFYQQVFLRAKRHYTNKSHHPHATHRNRFFGLTLFPSDFKNQLRPLQKTSLDDAPSSSNAKPKISRNHQHDHIVKTLSGTEFATKAKPGSAFVKLLDYHLEQSLSSFEQDLPLMTNATREAFLICLSRSPRVDSQYKLARLRTLKGIAIDDVTHSLESIQKKRSELEREDRERDSVKNLTFRISGPFWSQQWYRDARPRTTEAIAYSIANNNFTAIRGIPRQGKSFHMSLAGELAAEVLGAEIVSNHDFKDWMDWDETEDSVWKFDKILKREAELKAQGKHQVILIDEVTSLWRDEDARSFLEKLMQNKDQFKNIHFAFVLHYTGDQMSEFENNFKDVPAHWIQPTTRDDILNYIDRLFEDTVIARPQDGNIEKFVNAIGPRPFDINVWLDPVLTDMHSNRYVQFDYDATWSQVRHDINQLTHTDNVYRIANPRDHVLIGYKGLKKDGTERLVSEFYD